MAGRRRSVEQLTFALNAAFKKSSNKREAPKMKKYMRNQFEFLGIKAPERRIIQKQIFSKFDKLSAAEIYEALRSLWQKEEREFQYSALDLASGHKKTLSTDISTCTESVQVIEELITTKSWWDTVDILASNVIGHLIAQFPGQFDQKLDDWIHSDNMWLRRTAIIHQLSYKSKTDESRLFRYCLKCSNESEFFIQKAIGWALRTYHRENPQAIRKFVKEHQDKLAKLSIREALKHD